MKVAWIITGVVLVALAVAGFVFRRAIGFGLFALAITPSGSFRDDATPPAPDYANADAWAALPDRDDRADVVPPGEADAQASAPVDVFFVHPTTYYKRDGWNQPLDDADANTITDERVLQAQASVFNGCCRIYAPRYRQATLAAFFDEEGDGARALDLAYADIELAFDRFLALIGDRPFVLASHSQGSRHLEILLEKRISRTPLQARLVAAYPIGFGIDAESFAQRVPDVPLCSAAAQTGCYVTWNAVGAQAESFGDASKSACVNPLSWRIDSAPAPHEANLGSFAFDTEPRVVPAAADARCLGGRLLVSELRTQQFAGVDLMFGEGNYHVLDYSLFYLNLRANAIARVAAYRSRMALSSTPPAPASGTLQPSTPPADTTE